MRWPDKMDGNIPQASMEAETTAPSRFGRAGALLRVKHARLAGGLLAALVLIGFAVQFLIDRAAYVSTADARIASDMIAVSADVSGRITNVAVGEGDRVSAGDVLFTIDDREAVYALAELEAEAERLRAEIAREEMRVLLASSKAGSEVAARTAGTQSAAAALVAARSDYETAQRDFDRTQDLFDKGRVSQAALDQARNVLDTAEQAVHRAEAERERAAAEQRTASISGEEVRLIDYELAVLKAALQKAEARLDAQKVVVDQHTIRSPIDGVVDEVFFDAGEHSLHGFRMALLHDPDTVWVSANIKETNIRHVRPGADVIIKADAYPGVELKGHVSSIHDATIGEAALMPNPNASGVFTKITQRIAVRIDVEPANVQLRPGTMVRVRIRKASGNSARG
ncbi:HlyD family secretion protein [Henriciella mobilis]|nr:HlyD family secretion protein [Henriciella mobilis]